MSDPNAPGVDMLTWNWRRVFTFALTAALVAFVWRTAERVTDIALLREAVKWSQWTVLALVFTYVAGATATDWVQLVQAAKTSRKIVEDGEPPAPTTVASLAGAEPPAAEPTDGGELPPGQRVETP